jgi:hypothetical protein
MSAETIFLAWKGPYSFRVDAPDSVFVCPLSAASGVYAWAVPTPRGLLPLRIGGTGKPFWQRHYEHLEAYRRGQYPIHRAASLAAGRRDPLYRGQLANRRDSAFQMRRRKLEPDLRATLSLLAIFLAPLDVGIRIRQRVESGILRRLQSRGQPESALLERHRVPYPPPRLHEPAIRVRSEVVPRVHGLAGEFEC